MEVEHRESPEPKYIGGYYSHEPLQKLPKPWSTPQSLGNCLYVTLLDKDTIFPYIGHFFLKPKYQFSLRGNIKDRRDLRGGVNFETPLPMVYAVWPSVSSSGTVILSFL